MANQKISELDSIAIGSVTDADQLIITDSEAAQSKKLSIGDYKKALTMDAVSVECVGLTTGTYNSSVNVAFTEVAGKDLYNAWDGNKFTCPPNRAGWYSVAFSVFMTSNGSSLWQRIVNDSLSLYAGRLENIADHHVRDLVYLNAGDTLAYRPLATLTLTNSTQRSWLTIVKVA